MELQVDLRRGGAVGAADHVELPVAERCPHRVQVVHRHPRPVLGPVAAVRVRSPGAALIDEQDVAIHVQHAQLLAPVGRRLGGGVSRSAGEIRDRVLSGRLRERRQDDHVEPDRAAVRLRAVLRDDEGAAAGVDPLHHARLRRPRPLRLSAKERSVDADGDTDADAGGGRQADQRPNNPPTPPMNPMRRRRAHLSTWANLHPETIPQPRATRDQGKHGSCVRAFPNVRDRPGTSQVTCDPVSWPSAVRSRGRRTRSSGSRRSP